MARIAVYGQPGCVQCRATEKKLGQLGVDFDYYDVSVDRDALSFVLGLGYKQAPVVVCGSEHFSGYNPDGLRRFAGVV